MALSNQFSISVPPDVAQWVEASVTQGLFTNRSAAFVEAVRALRYQLDNQSTLQAQLDGTTSSTQELIDAVGAISVVDCIPVVRPGKETRQLNILISSSDLRNMEQLLHAPGLPHKTPADLARAFIRVGLLAVNRLREINHPAWARSVALAEAAMRHDTREQQVRDFGKAQADFLIELDEAVARAMQTRTPTYIYLDRIEEVYNDFYQLIVQMGPHQEQEGLSLLADNALAQWVVWQLFTHGARVPDEQLVPDHAPALPQPNERKALPAPSIDAEWWTVDN